jgi:hypothetical protein
MSTQWNLWKSTLLAQGKGPLDLAPATRGQYYEVTITYPGNVTTATLTGSVRSSPDSGTALAAFTIGSPAFAGGVTTWAASLAEGTGAGSTGVLPSDSDGDGVEEFPYDFLLTFAGASAERLFGGILPVSGHITEPV